GPVPDHSENIRIFLYNAGIAALGVLTSFLTVFPTYNDSIINHRSIAVLALIKAALLPAMQFPDTVVLPAEEKLALFGKPLVILKSLILFGSTLGLIRRPGAFLAALTT